MPRERRPAIALGLLVAGGVAVRVAMFPARDLIGDLDQFVLWVHGIAVNGWLRAYDQNLSFPAVMAWIWGVLAAVEPDFRTVTDSSDPWIRGLMKVPASLADLGLAAGVWWWFRDRPWVAVTAAGAVLLWPVTWYVSAWWGQYESIYVLPALLAVLAARAGRPGLVAALVAVSLMTKPQALPLVVPFAAWFLATQRWRGTARAAAIGAVVAVVLWLPFIPAGGPLDYLDNLQTYQDDIFGVLSLRAWNPWWIVQELGAGGGFVADTTPVLGPFTFRHVGYAIAGLLSLVVFVGVYRRPTAEQLALGLAAISLVAFVSLTTMHERYAYPAFVFLLLAAGRPGELATWALFAVAFALNLVTAAPPEGWTIPLERPLGIAGAVAITGVAALRLISLGRAPGTGPASPPSTSAGSGAATSGA
ncbi:MAG: hypothetical protein A2V85_11335 [Chloroflexi bacterium RBG_16_72_14]|nr:MAG: hypothetical protein A2V85_11335 [Chloroflexi bacterium RBG_16_72_14]